MVGRIEAASSAAGTGTFFEPDSFKPRRVQTGLTQAIVKTLERHARDRFLTPVEVRHCLALDGFKPTTKNFSNIVGNMLMRLGKRKIIRVEAKDYGSTYAARV